MKWENRLFSSDPLIGLQPGFSMNFIGRLDPASDSFTWVMIPSILLKVADKSNVPFSICWLFTSPCFLCFVYSKLSVFWKFNILGKIHSFWLQLWKRSRNHLTSLLAKLLADMSYLTFPYLLMDRGKTRSKDHHS